MCDYFSNSDNIFKRDLLLRECNMYITGTEA